MWSKLKKKFIEQFKPLLSYFCDRSMLFLQADRSQHKKAINVAQKLFKISTVFK